MSSLFLLMCTPWSKGRRCHRLQIWLWSQSCVWPYSRGWTACGLPVTMSRIQLHMEVWMQRSRRFMTSFDAMMVLKAELYTLNSIRMYVFFWSRWERAEGRYCVVRGLVWPVGELEWVERNGQWRCDASFDCTHKALHDDRVEGYWAIVYKAAHIR